MRITLPIFMLLAVSCSMELAKSSDEPREKKEQVITIDGSIVYYDEIVNTQVWQTYPGTDLHDLHNDCVYFWKINLSDYAIDKETKIDKAVIIIDDITNTGSDGMDTLFINIVDVVSPPSGFQDHVVSMKDTFSTGNDNAFNHLPSSGDLHWSKGTHLTTWHDADGPGTATTLKLELTPAALDTLNTYRSDNNWIGFGLDPDGGTVMDPNRLYSNNRAHIELTVFQ